LGALAAVLEPGVTDYVTAHQLPRSETRAGDVGSNRAHLGSLAVQSAINEASLTRTTIDVMALILASESETDFDVKASALPPAGDRATLGRLSHTCYQLPHRPSRPYRSLVSSDCARDAANQYPSRVVSCSTERECEVVYAGR